jgi:L-threonylcarbamoyladenylate synthase
LTRARVLAASDPQALREAGRIIRLGGLVAFPTETVYGLGSDACNPIAVARVFEVKRRPSIDPLIVHVADPDDARHFGQFPDTISPALMSTFWPGPLTLVVPKHDVIPAIVTAGLDTVALRVPSHPSALALIRTSGRALAAPSANPFGYVSPTRADHVFDQLGEAIDLILDGGPCKVGVESTILSLTGGVPRLLRAGGIPVEEIESVVGPVERPAAKAVRPEAPGQLTRHYATKTRLQILNEDDPSARPGEHEKVGLITLTSPRRREGYSTVEVLSDSGNMREAAANLFSALRRLDSCGLDRLVAFPMPETGLGLAIMDRLRKCAVPSQGNE